MNTQILTPMIENKFFDNNLNYYSSSSSGIDLFFVCGMGFFEISEKKSVETMVGYYEDGIYGEPSQTCWGYNKSHYNVHE